MDERLAQVPAPLLRQLVDGRWLPIVGAGFSRNAWVPSGDSLPDWKGLGSLLGKDIPELEYDGPLDAASAYQQAFGRPALIERVSSLLRIHDARPSAVHLAFARLGFEDVVTTNFDMLLERAYDLVQRACLPLIEESQLSNRNVYPGPRLLKLHGDTNHPVRLVITEDDYDGFLSRHPLLATSLGALLINHTSVLIGYSLDDPDMRQILQLVKDRLGSLAPPLWAIQVDAPQYIVNRYERRGVRVINLPKKRGESYADRLSGLFDALRDYWREELIDESQSTDERALADLQLPSSSSRICYFAVPIELLSWYREFIFPAVERFGFVPLAARDILTPSGTSTTKIDALINRAALIVAEITGRNAAFEVSLAVRDHPRQSILLVADDASAVSFPDLDLEAFRIVLRPRDLTESIEVLRKAIVSWIEESAPYVQFGAVGESEPERLIAAKEYRAALIAAVALLETRLGRVTGLEQGSSFRRPPLAEIARRAASQGLINDDEQNTIVNSIRLRNGALHQDRHVTQNEAIEAVRVIMEVVRRLG